jgi:tetratricopeptide (TPR) repeat protein
MPFALSSQPFARGRFLHSGIAEWFFAVVLVFLAAGPSPVRADDEGEGRKRFQHGQELFLQGRYLEAAQAFESGYAVAPRNGFLINIAHSYRRAGELEKARTYYLKLLELDPNTPQRAEVEGNLRSIDDALSVQNIPPPVKKKPEPPVPDPKEAFRGKVAAESSAATHSSETTDAGGKPKATEDEEGGSVFGKAWFWALLLTTAAVGGFVAVAVLKSDTGCNADVCVSEMK